MAMNERYLPDFSGKVVSMQMKLTGIWWTLLGPALERQAGKLFFVGRTVPGDPAWCREARIYIPWDLVAYYVVFDSLESYQSRPVSPTPPPVVVEKRRGWFGRGRNP